MIVLVFHILKFQGLMESKDMVEHASLKILSPFLSSAINLPYWLKPLKSTTVTDHSTNEMKEKKNKISHLTMYNQVKL